MNSTSFSLVEVIATAIGGTDAEATLAVLLGAAFGFAADFMMVGGVSSEPSEIESSSLSSSFSLSSWSCLLFLEPATTTFSRCAAEKEKPQKEVRRYERSHGQHKQLPTPPESTLSQICNILTPLGFIVSIDLIIVGFLSTVCNTEERAKMIKNLLV
jgi:hypothetical protein